MLKNILLAGALLVPVLAYGGSPNTDLSVQIVPAASTTPPPSSPTPPPPPPSPTPPPPSGGTACGATPVGAAASDVTAAGFNTCALYYDWTYGIPNSVGNGLTTSWIDCSQSGGTSPNADWTWGQNWVDLNGTTPCTANGNSSNSDIFEDTDSNGNPALHIVTPASQMTAGTNYWALTTGPYAGAYPEPNVDGDTLPWNFGDGFYIETTYKDSLNNSVEAYNGMELFNFGISNYSSSCEGTTELDFMETDGANTGYVAAHSDSANCGSSQPVGYTVSANTTGYTTVGALVTNNGTNDVRICQYVNGTRTGCNDVPMVDSEGQVYERRPILFKAGYTCTSGTCPQADSWIKYVKVYSCSNWQSSTPTQSVCSGSTLNGTGFYVP
jgi:hypothetical protein